jgi:hypothetical protein
MAKRTRKAFRKRVATKAMRRRATRNKVTKRRKRAARRRRTIVQRGGGMTAEQKHAFLTWMEHMRDHSEGGLDPAVLEPMRRNPLVSGKYLPSRGDAAEGALPEAMRHPLVGDEWDPNTYFRQHSITAQERDVVAGQEALDRATAEVTQNKGELQNLQLRDVDDFKHNLRRWYKLRRQLYDLARALTKDANATSDYFPKGIPRHISAMGSDPAWVGRHSFGHAFQRAFTVPAQTAAAAAGARMATVAGIGARQEAGRTELARLAREYDDVLGRVHRLREQVSSRNEGRHHWALSADARMGSPKSPGSGSDSDSEESDDGQSRMDPFAGSDGPAMLGRFQEDQDRLWADEQALRNRITELASAPGFVIGTEQGRFADWQNSRGKAMAQELLFLRTQLGIAESKTRGQDAAASSGTDELSSQMAHLFTSPAIAGAAPGPAARLTALAAAASPGGGTAVSSSAPPFAPVRQFFERMRKKQRAPSAAPTAVSTSIKTVSSPSKTVSSPSKTVSSPSKTGSSGDKKTIPVRRSSRKKKSGKEGTP